MQEEVQQIDFVPQRAGNLPAFHVQHHGVVCLHRIGIPPRLIGSIRITRCCKLSPLVGNTLGHQAVFQVPKIARFSDIVKDVGQLP